MFIGLPSEGTCDCSRSRTSLRDVVKDIIAQGANLDRLDAEGSAALHIACIAERYHPDVYEVVKSLVGRGANFILVDGEGRTPLKIAKEYKCAIIAEYLEKVGAVE